MAVIEVGQRAGWLLLMIMPWHSFFCCYEKNTKVRRCFTVDQYVKNNEQATHQEDAP